MNADILRFAILHHTGWPSHPDHYDLLLQLETGTDDDARVLKAFATVADVFPAAGARLTLNADHRRIYLDFEGDLSNNRGRVERVDGGEISQINVSRGFNFLAAGKRWVGRYCIRAISDGDYELQQLGPTADRK